MFSFPITEPHAASYKHQQKSRYFVRRLKRLAAIGAKLRKAWWPIWFSETGLAFQPPGVEWGSYDSELNARVTKLLADIGVEEAFSGPSRGETLHKQVPIQWEGRSAEVDEGIAPLILAIWKRGIDTVMSCQENRPGVIWIMFASFVDAKWFLDLTDFTIEWEFHYRPSDYIRWHPEVGEKLGISRFFQLLPSVRFPAADLADVMASLNAAVPVQLKTQLSAPGGIVQELALN